MGTKLKINLKEGILEVEGSESFVKQIYNDFKPRLNVASDDSIKSNNSPDPAPKPSKPRTRSKPSGSGRASKTINAPRQLLTKLNLRPRGKKSLKKFVSEFKKPKTAEKYLLYVYYLINELEVSGVTLDHIYTCIKEIGDKVPTHLKQTITNIKNSKGWIDTTNFEDLKYTVQGMNHVEHDMEKTDS